MTSKAPVDAVLVGAGRRGYRNFGRYALEHPGDLRIIAVAEPNDALRTRFARAHDIPTELTFRSWEDLADRVQLAPALLNASNDTTHYASTMAAMEAGYQVLTEKPVATSPEQCVSLARTADSLGADVWVCHELRNSNYFSTVREIVRSGRLGEIVHVGHRENVSYWHMAHSFIRGNWSNKSTSGPMILTKCCHDFDILSWILGMRVKRLSSFGSLRHYRPERAPHPDVPERCTDGCPVEDECPFYAPRIYLGERMELLAGSVSLDTSRAGVMRGLETGPLGRCVYRAGNDVVDHQVVSMESEDGLTVTLTMHGHSHVEGRSMRYDGSRATLIGDFSDPEPDIVVHDHLTETSERTVPYASAGHGGGDERLMAAFVRAVRDGDRTGLSNVQEAVQSHLLAFAAEESRLNGGVLIDMDEYARRFETDVDAQGEAP